MNDIYKNLREHEILFLIEIEPKNKYFGLDGMISIQRKFPNSVEIIVSKFGLDICKFVCITEKNADLEYIRETCEVKVKKI
jgi:hypothetical protein